MSWEFELLQEPYGGVSEGPVWRDGVLFYTQIQACRVMRFDAAAGSFAVHRDDTNYANGLCPYAERHILACEGGGRRVGEQGGGETAGQGLGWVPGGLGWSMVGENGLII